MNRITESKKMSINLTASILSVLFILANSCLATSAKLFPTELPESRWVEFSAAGFSQPVSGVIYRADNPPCCGVPVGAVSTGCIDIDVRGVYGFSSIFNPESSVPYKKGWRMPRKLPQPGPLLGLSVGGRTWVLASKEIVNGGQISWCTEPLLQGKWAEGEYKPHQVDVPKIQAVSPTRQIHYWGHFPVADVEFEICVNK